MEATAGGSFRLDCFHSTGIIERLQDSKNYGALGCVDVIGDAVSQKQMESLGRILLSLKTTMEEFHSIVLSLEKLYLDGRQLVKGGFQSIHGEAAAAKSWYFLKASIVSALPTLVLKPISSSDLGALEQLLFDQPNIPKEEV